MSDEGRCSEDEEVGLLILWGKDIDADGIQMQRGSCFRFPRGSRDISQAVNLIEQGGGASRGFET